MLFNTNIQININKNKKKKNTNFMYKVTLCNFSISKKNPQISLRI